MNDYNQHITMATEFEFVVLKINGFDVTGLQQDKMVEMFLNNQKESIVFEVKPKCYDKNYADDGSCLNNEKSKDRILLQSDKDTDINNVFTNLEISKQSKHQNLELTLKIQENVLNKYHVSKSTQTEYINSYFEMHVHHKEQHLPRQEQDIATKEQVERLIEEEHNLLEQCLAPEIDIEEITLRKSASNERLGLTVCYSISESNVNNSDDNNGVNNINVTIMGSAAEGVFSDDNEVYTEVYISDIQPDSIAGRDGRLRQGDQILQINGKDIKNKDETDALIAENCNAVTLLVSRYMYADEDDFNEPSVVEIDVEDGDEEDDIYYDSHNFAYETCLLQKKISNDAEELDKVLQHAANQQKVEHKVQILQQQKQGNDMKTIQIIDTLPNFKKSNDFQQSELVSETALNTNIAKINSAIINNKLKNVNKEFQTQKYKLSESINNENNKELAQHTNQKCAYNQLDAASQQNSKSNGDYDFEHIYETIPEDSECEPFYCSPYQSPMYVTAVATCPPTLESMHTEPKNNLQQKQQLRVAQWLGLKSQALNVESITTKTKQSVSRTEPINSNFNRYSRANNTVRTNSTTITNGSSSSDGTVGGISHFIPIDERDNSSSAYNTGGSNNSDSTFILQQRVNSGTYNVNVTEDEQVQFVKNAYISKHQRLIYSKDNKIPNPKNSALILINSKDHSVIVPSTIETQLQQQNNNFSNSMLSNNKVKHSSEQTLLHQEQSPQQIHQILNFPEFTAPNLSQYHFVSSQEVSTTDATGLYPYTPSIANSLKSPTKTATVNQESHTLYNNEDKSIMVWKVKRRPDGSRYIVRRPATTTNTAISNTIANSTSRNRFLRADRTMRFRNNDNYYLTTTTEDETISEVKTGRYWSKEDRKKHIERARERRHQHSQLRQYLQRQHDMPQCEKNFMSTIPINDEIAYKLHQHERQQQNSQLSTQNLSQQQSLTHFIHKFTTNKTKSSRDNQQYYQLQFNSGNSANVSQKETVDVMPKMPTTMCMPKKFFVGTDLYICSTVNNVLDNISPATTTTMIKNITDKSNNASIFRQHAPDTVETQNQQIQ